jgi:hypothetical protein
MEITEGIIAGFVEVDKVVKKEWLSSKIAKDEK